MQYRLTHPCANCPFRTDIRPYLRPGRVREILTIEGEFQCHKTIGAKAQVCAGWLIVREHDRLPNQMMRIAERIGMYDPNALDMRAPVYRGIAAAIAAHRGKR